MMGSSDFEYTTLKRAVFSLSPFRSHLRATFPDFRGVAAEYKKAVGPILAPGEGITTHQTSGTALDTLVQMHFEPGEVPDAALRGSMYVSGMLPDMRAVDLVVELSEAGSDSAEVRARVAWAFALFTEAHRSALPPNALMEALSRDDVAAEDLLALATDEAVVDLVALEAVAAEAFYPQIAEPVTVGVPFDAEWLPFAAEADILTDGALVEVKTLVGKKNAAGVRYGLLKPDVMYQLLAYALIDEHDELGITGLGLYSARYGHYSHWELQPLLDRLAGRPVGLAAERQRVRKLLEH